MDVSVRTGFHVGETPSGELVLHSGCHRQTDATRLSGETFLEQFGPFREEELICSSRTCSLFTLILMDTSEKVMTLLMNQSQKVKFTSTRTGNTFT